LTSLRIIDGTDRAAIERLLARAGAERAFDRRVHGIVDRVRKGGDRALAGFARRFDRVEPPFEITPAEMHAEASRLAPDVRRAIATASRHIARVVRR
jgi:histidinol dehydrogenase